MCCSWKEDGQNQQDFYHTHRVTYIQGNWISSSLQVIPRIYSSSHMHGDGDYESVSRVVLPLLIVKKLALLLLLLFHQFLPSYPLLP